MTLDALLQHQAALLARAELAPEAMRATADRALDEGRCDARRERAAMIDAIDQQPALGEKVTTYPGDAFGIEGLIGHHRRVQEREESPDRVPCGGFHGVVAIDHLKHVTRVEALRWLDVHDA